VGWVLSGPTQSKQTDNAVIGFVDTYVLRVDSVTDEGDTDGQLTCFWELESLRVKPIEESVHSKFIQEICYKDGRYEVSLPWRDGNFLLPDNYELCVKRLRGLQHRLVQDPDLLRAYHEIIQEQARSKVIERVPEMDSSQARVHYLPHHPVVREDKSTTKVRVVYDASCSETGLSLNQCLHVGPSFGQSILDILVRFRMNRVALIGDIEKAFLMVGIAEKDRDVLRFLWYEDPFSPTPKLIKFRFTRVMFGVSASPFLLNATVRHHIMRYREEDPEFVSRFRQGIYVDDLTTGGDCVEDCYEFYIKSKIRLLEACSTLMDRISLNEGCQASATLNQKVLGVSWDPMKDQLLFDVSSVLDNLAAGHLTKRTVIGAAARIYNPVRILALSPFVLRSSFSSSVW
jgi:hypothetical protein